MAPAFLADRVGPMGLRIYDHLVVGNLACNCYVVGDPDTMQAIVIDPGDDARRILDAVSRRGLKLIAAVATHAHFDHVLAAEALRVLTGAPFYLHLEDMELLKWLPDSLALFLGVHDGPPAPQVDRRLADGDEIGLGARGLRVIHTPGHSPGSICLVSEGPQDAMVFSGDTLFASSVGRTDLPGGDQRRLITSVRQRLFPLGDLPVYPGHGPATTLGKEKVGNPFVGYGARFWGT